MTTAAGPTPPDAPTPSGSGGNGMPTWLTVTVVLTLIGLFAYNLIINGTEGLANSYVIAGLLGAFGASERFLNRGGGS